jgi:voltage-gated potassium channel Kch
LSTPRQPAPRSRPAWRPRLRLALRHLWWRIRRTDPYIAAFSAAALALFAVGTSHFREAFGTDWLVAAYFVMSTMTTTGYGDITPHHDDPTDIAAAMVLMLLGTVFTGIFIAFVASRLTHAQWVRMQGLRPIHRRGHIVVCGCGRTGTRVIELLLAFGKPLVVVEQHPDAVLVERARDRGFDLLTGDASRDDTLDLCNLGAAHSLVALTNVDTLNLEIALGGRARNPSMPIVLRIAEAEFAASIARHFQFETTFSVAALAGPVFGGLARFAGARGRIEFEGREFAIAEIIIGPTLDSEMLRLAIPLAAAEEGGDFVLSHDFAGLPPGTRALILMPLAPFRDGTENPGAMVERVAGG